MGGKGESRSDSHGRLLTCRTSPRSDDVGAAAADEHVSQHVEFALYRRRAKSRLKRGAQLRRSRHVGRLDGDSPLIRWYTNIGAEAPMSLLSLMAIIAFLALGTPSFALAQDCVKDYSVCEAPISYFGRCATSLPFVNTKEDKQRLEEECGIRWPCYNYCDPDYEAKCPRFWYLEGGVCMPTPAYQGRCADPTDLRRMREDEKVLWGNRCGVKWPCKVSGLLWRADLPQRKCAANYKAPCPEVGMNENKSMFRCRAGPPSVGRMHCWHPTSGCRQGPMRGSGVLRRPVLRDRRPLLLQRRNEVLAIVLLGVRRVRLGRNGLHDDGHEAVQSPAHLGALAVEHALAHDEGVHAVQTAGHRVRLDAEARHGPRVDDVSGRDQKADVRAGRQGQTLVDLQLAKHTRHQVVVSHHVGLERVVLGDEVRVLRVLLREWVPLLGGEARPLRGRRLAVRDARLEKIKDVQPALKRPHDSRKGEVIAGMRGTPPRARAWGSDQMVGGYTA
ncbi:CPW-WPC domain-containing protein [Babesia caballi]|uniref:CPW-WPC domain-containing protein n=1 Tax=Babesia caballi TaxID=5871 RepID=A0AAV4LRX0_BABCB|nr:CPW-WPC domain-containing protein [Babesia caballi]